MCVPLCLYVCNTRSVGVNETKYEKLGTLKEKPRNICFLEKIPFLSFVLTADDALARSRPAPVAETAGTPHAARSLRSASLRCAPLRSARVGVPASFPARCASCSRIAARSFAWPGHTVIVSKKESFLFLVSICFLLEIVAFFHNRFHRAPSRSPGRKERSHGLHSLQGR